VKENYNPDNHASTGSTEPQGWMTGFEIHRDGWLRCNTCRCLVPTVQDDAESHKHWHGELGK
jgi:hypothetical protein